MFSQFLLAFIPVFVAVDAIGTLPVFVAMTHELDKKTRTKIIVQSLWTAIALTTAFVYLGRKIFDYLGIQLSDFMIAGGIILFCLAISDLLVQPKENKVSADDMGVVPIGIPLIAGPAVLTTGLILVDQYGFEVTLAAIVVNIILAGLIFFFSDLLIRVLGQVGSRALSKITALFLAAIAVMMVRKGIMAFL